MKKLHLCLLALSFIFSVNAQTLVSTAGDQVQLENIHVDWSIGEPVIETFNQDNILLTQGLHQSVLIVTAVSPIIDEDIELQVFPNPTVATLHINVSGQNQNLLNLQLFTAEGRLILSKDMQSDIETIDMTQFAAGNYILQVNDSKEIKIQSFKIIKTN